MPDHTRPLKRHLTWLKLTNWGLFVGLKSFRERKLLQQEEERKKLKEEATNLAALKKRVVVTNNNKASEFVRLKLLRKYFDIWFKTVQNNKIAFEKFKVCNSILPFFTGFRLLVGGEFCFGHGIPGESLWL